MEFLTFGPYLARTRFAFLNQLGHARQALILGDGDGRFTARLLRINPAIQIDAVDSSSAMLRTLLRKACPHSTRVRTHQADARQFHPLNPPYDLIVTHFFLDCLTTTEIQSLAATIRAAAAPRALWLVSEFAIPPGLYGRLIAAPLLRVLYQTFALLTGLTVRTLPDHHSALSHSSFALQARRTHLAGLLVSELWSLASPPAAQLLQPC
jgi:ubiquinone/menaquinone biosynthesis C-methylase UbiE